MDNIIKNEELKALKMKSLGWWWESPGVDGGAVDLKKWNRDNRMFKKKSSWRLEEYPA